MCEHCGISVGACTPNECQAFKNKYVSSDKYNELMNKVKDKPFPFRQLFDDWYELKNKYEQLKEEYNKLKQLHN